MANTVNSYFVINKYLFIFNKPDVVLLLKFVLEYIQTQIEI